MVEELEDFLVHCGVERRLAPLTCSAYERASQCRQRPSEAEAAE
jgi:hypothetical protein